jgi:PhnB protein
MSQVSTYLNFPRNTEEAFNFYKSVFGGEFSGGGIMRMGDVPPVEGVPPLADDDKNLIMHIELPILDGHKLMGTDAPESMGFNVKFGNNSYITLDPETRAEAKRLFNALSEGGKIEAELEVMFWGDYYGSFTDKFGVQWMINCTATT